jgi:hypothetical protein
LAEVQKGIGTQGHQAFVKILCDERSPFQIINCQPEN